MSGGEEKSVLHEQLWQNNGYSEGSYGGHQSIIPEEQPPFQIFDDCTTLSGYLAMSDGLPNTDDCMPPTASCNGMSQIPDRDSGGKQLPEKNAYHVAGPTIAAFEEKTRTITELSNSSSQSHIRYTTSPLPQSPSQEMTRPLLTQLAVPPQQHFMPSTVNVPRLEDQYNVFTDVPNAYNPPPPPLTQLQLNPCSTDQELSDLHRDILRNNPSSPYQVSHSQQYAGIYLATPYDSAATEDPLSIDSAAVKRRSLRLRGHSNSYFQEKRQHFQNQSRPYQRERRPRRGRGANSNDSCRISSFTALQRSQTPPESKAFQLADVKTHPVRPVSQMQYDPTAINEKRHAYLKIVEQPQQKALRFRYICEGRSAGSIPGIDSTPENKTFPTVKVFNYKGPAQVVVSCVTVEEPHRPHPHNLVGKEGCSDGICRVRIDPETMECSFSNLGIQCVKKKDVVDALKKRERRNIDPFGTGFAHRNQPQNIDLNAVRLCFQAYLEETDTGRFTFPLSPIISEAIYDKKATSDLSICRLSDCTSSTLGGKEIILLCDKVNKDDIQVRFYEVKDKMLCWEAYGDFQASDVHKQVAITFKTPKYMMLDIKVPVTVYIELVQPSDRARSDSRPFQYLPLESDSQYVKSKVSKLCNPTLKDDFNTLFGDVSEYLGLQDKECITEDPFTQCY